MKASNQPNQHTAFAVTAPGLESLCAAELREWHIRGIAEDGGVAWDGTMESIARANLWLRTASRVLVRVAEFRATAFYELELQAKRGWRMIGAALTHLRRKENQAVVINVVILVLAAFVAWGRFGPYSF